MSVCRGTVGRWAAVCWRVCCRCPTNCCSSTKPSKCTIRCAFSFDYTCCAHALIRERFLQVLPFTYYVNQHILSFLPDRQTRLNKLYEALSQYYRDASVFNTGDIDLFVSDDRSREGL